MSDLQQLAGKVLLDVRTGKRGDIPKGSRAYGGVFDQNTDIVTFMCEDGDWVFVADGDCCSQTTIESVDGPKKGRVLEVQEPEWGGAYREENEGETKFYKATLVIEGAGHLDVEYRNESNGYYGGSLELLSSPTPGVSPKEGP